MTLPSAIFRPARSAGLASICTTFLFLASGARAQPAAEAPSGPGQRSGAAVPAVRLTDTVKEAGPDGLVRRTLDRDSLWTVQTPQVFRRDLLEEAHRQVRADVTDDAAMLEALGHPVQLFTGSSLNLKITTEADLALAEALLARRNI